MPRVKQLRVAIQNRPGTLAHVARVLGKARVDIQAFQTGTTGKKGYVEVLVNDIRRAKQILRRERFSFREQDVLRIELRNVPGALGVFAGKLAARGINIDSGYAAPAKRSKKASVVLSVSHLHKAARIR